MTHIYNVFTYIKATQCIHTQYTDTHTQYTWAHTQLYTCNMYADTTPVSAQCRHTGGCGKSWILCNFILDTLSVCASYKGTFRKHGAPSARARRSVMTTNPTNRHSVTPASGRPQRLSGAEASDAPFRAQALGASQQPCGPLERMGYSKGVPSGNRGFHVRGQKPPS